WRTVLTKSISKLNINNPLVVTTLGNIKRNDLINIFNERILFSDIKNNPQDIEIRNMLLNASNLAGLTFSNIKTATAHSISYPLTISYGVPHGIACSTPIIPLLKINEEAIKMAL
ncbi:MAG: iron-containing alcohol dehydrogenase, partial [Planctomycetia bacterium]|nr:iron-containing alcohol dehydrogenase [Planctomycetia bacterium]